MWLKSFFLAVFLFSHNLYASDNLVTGHLQLVVVTSSSWQDKQGTLQRFEKTYEEEEWIPVGESIPVVLGKAGMAWGVGLHPSVETTVTSKIEGDLKSPAGVFSFGYAFGFAPGSQMSHLKIDYLSLNEFIEAVDDPLSHYYNRMVDNREQVCDWISSEKMGSESLYEMGLEVNHNWPNIQPGKGSAIFFHIWRSEHSGTAGCTAMSRENIGHILEWLDSSKKPLLIQLPSFVYSELQDEWKLPKLKKTNRPLA